MMTVYIEQQIPVPSSRSDSFNAVSDSVFTRSEF